MKTILALIALALVGCEQPLSGVITDKRYHPPYTTFTYVNVEDVLIPIPTPHPARWTITIRGTISDGKERVRVFDVGEQTWNQFKVGESYPPAEAKP